MHGQREQRSLAHWMEGSAHYFGDDERRENTEKLERFWALTVSHSLAEVETLRGHSLSDNTKKG